MRARPLRSAHLTLPLTLLLGSLPGSAAAEILRFEFEAVVTSIGIESWVPQNALDDVVEVGQTLHGSFAYDTETEGTDLGGLSDRTSYFEPGSGFLVLGLGPVTLVSGFSRVYVQNGTVGPDSLDSVGVETTNALPESDVIAWGTSLTAGSPTLFSDTSLPLALDLADFPAARVLVNAYQGGGERWAIQADILSLALVPPVPSLGQLGLALACALLAAAGRRQLRPNGR